MRRGTLPLLLTLSLVGCGGKTGGNTTSGSSGPGGTTSEGGSTSVGSGATSNAGTGSGQGGSGAGTSAHSDLCAWTCQEESNVCSCSAFHKDRPGLSDGEDPCAVEFDGPTVDECASEYGCCVVCHTEHAEICICQRVDDADLCEVGRAGFEDIYQHSGGSCEITEATKCN